jgi:hypothetical protein
VSVASKRSLLSEKREHFREFKMSVVKSFAVGAGDMFYILHNSDNFTIIDSDLGDDNSERFLDNEMPIANFYVVKNQAIKDQDTDSFRRYCQLRDGEKAFYIYKGCTRRWMNQANDERGTSGISILWPDIANPHFKEALALCDAGASYNNTSAVIRYRIENGASFLWLGDLETEFMENITDSIELSKTTIVFAAHHGRDSGKIPNAWLEKLDPQIIVIGESPSRHLHYYTGYKTITQNSAGDIIMDCVDDQVHFYVSSETYTNGNLEYKAQSKYTNYIGSLTVETEYTL